jgi:hypothetical protein
MSATMSGNAASNNNKHNDEHDDECNNNQLQVRQQGISRTLPSFIPPLQVKLIVAGAVVQAVACLHESIFGTDDSCHIGFRGQGPPRPQKQRTVEEIFDCLGSTYFRRAYRMTFESFMVLHNKICHLIKFYAKQHIYAGCKKIRCGRQADAELYPLHHQMDLFCPPQGLAVLYDILLVAILRTSWLIMALVSLMY